MMEVNKNTEYQVNTNKKKWGTASNVTTDKIRKEINTETAVKWDIFYTDKRTGHQQNKTLGFMNVKYKAKNV